MLGLDEKAVQSGMRPNRQIGLGLSLQTPAVRSVGDQQCRFVVIIGRCVEDRSVSPGIGTAHQGEGRGTVAGRCVWCA